MTYIRFILFLLLIGCGETRGPTIEEWTYLDDARYSWPWPLSEECAANYHGAQVKEFDSSEPCV